jgi:hypothetical protein
MQQPGSPSGTSSPAGAGGDVIISQQHDYHDKRLFFVGGSESPDNDYEGGRVTTTSTMMTSTTVMDAPVATKQTTNTTMMTFSDEKKDNNDDDGAADVDDDGVDVGIQGGSTIPHMTFITKLQQKVHEHFFSSSKDGLLDSARSSAFSRTETVETSLRSDPPASKVSDSSSAVSSLAEDRTNNWPNLPPTNNTITSTSRDDLGPSTSPPPPSPTQARAAYEVVARLQLEAARRNKQGFEKSKGRAKDSTVEEEAPTTTITEQSNVRFKLAEKSTTKTDMDIKREKGMKWKQKMKIAQAQKRKERKALDEASTPVASDNPLRDTGKALIACVLDEVEHTSFLKTFTQCGGDLADGDESVYAYSEPSSRSESGSDEDEESNVPNRRGRSRGRQRNMRKPSVDSSNASSTVDQSTVDSTTVAGTEASLTPSRHTNNDDRRMQGPSKTTLSSDNVSSLPTDAAAYHNGKIGDDSTKPAYVSPTLHSSSATPTLDPHANIRKGPSFAKAFIAKMEHIGGRMLWHKETSVMNPATVVMVLKKGHRCPDGTHCGPRLVWSEAQDDNVDNGKSKRNQGPIYGINLFDIALVERADPLQLENFPFAIPGRTFCLNLKDGRNERLIFEGTSEDDAARMVRGLRLVAARMARNLVMGNLEISCEMLDLADGDGRFGRRKGNEMGSTGRSPRSAMEFDWSRAMDDATEKLLEATSYQI